MENYKLKSTKKFLKVYMKVEETIIKFGDNEIEKQKLHQPKRPISIKIQILIKWQYLTKSLYKDAKKFRPLCIFLSKMSEYRIDFDETKSMFFFLYIYKR